jgi:hypothetical protein
MAKKAPKPIIVPKPRRANGTFPKGPSPDRGHGGARPGAGRKPMMTQEVVAEIQAMTTATGEPVAIHAFKVLTAQMDAAQPSKDKITAARIVLDRVLGKPKETMDVVVNRNAELDTAIEAAVMHAQVAKLNGETKPQT